MNIHRAFIYTILLLSGSLLLLGASCNNLPTNTENNTNTTTTPIVSTASTTTTASTISKCTSDQDCGEKGFLICKNNECVKGPGTDTEVCGSGANTWGCKAGQWCGLKYGECKNTPDCTSNSNCATDQRCLNGYCGPKLGSSCNSSDDCASKSLTCTSNLCVSKPIVDTEVCGSGANTWGCKAGQWCGLKYGECKNTPDCTTNSNCATDQRCLNGYCGPKLGSSCNSSDDCASKSLTCTSNLCVSKPIVDTEVCGSGANTWGCKAGQWCGLKYGECKNTPDCTTNSNCATDQRCLNGYCGPKLGSGCNSSDDCASKGLTCTNNLCTSISNGGDIEVCGSGANTWGCKAGQWCGTKYGECKSTGECTKDSDCGNEKLYCNVLGSFCAQKYGAETGKSCNTSFDCGDVENYLCRNNVCTYAFPGTKKCSLGSAIWYCQNDSYGCSPTFVNSCQPPCQADTKCPGGTSCMQGLCQ